VLDTLIDRKNGHIPGSAQPAVVEHTGYASQNPGGSVCVHEYPVDEIRAGNVERIRRNLGLVLQQGLCFIAE
jgi:hypothetical protein